MLRNFNSSHLSNSSSVDNDIKCLILKIPYMGPEGDKLVKTLKKKIQRNLSERLNIRVIYMTNKLSNFCSEKDKIPEGQRSNVIYKIKCPGCGENYVGKTSCCFQKRMDEHGTKSDQPMFLHLENCEPFKYISTLHDLPSNGSDSHGINRKLHIHEAVKENSKVLLSSNDWLKLAYLEPFMAKKHRSTINHGSKAMKVLQLF